MNKKLLNLLIALILVIFSWTASYLTSSDIPSSEVTPLLYSNQTRDDLQLHMSKAIEQAEKSVLLIIFTLTYSKIINALKHKSEEGVNVKVICDGNATPTPEHKLGPKVQILKRFGKGFMHLKILVVDNAQVWLGSANMTGESLKLHANLMLAMHHPELAAMVIGKANSMPEEGHSPPVLHREFLMDGQKTEMWFLPDDSQAIDRLKRLLASAKKTIRVAMFTWTRIDLAKIIAKAAESGVDVEVVLDYNASRGSGAKVTKFLKKNGIKTNCYQGGGLLHHKFAYIDQQTLINGSANWTKAAFEKNDDCFMVLHNLSEKQQRHLDTLWEILIKDSKKL